MSSKLILTLTAIIYALVGLGLTFAPDEIAGFLKTGTSPMLVLLLQLYGGAVLTIALLNWMNKGNYIGGIYNRPLIMANISHCFICAVALLKTHFGNTHADVSLSIYAVILLGIGLLFFRLMNSTTIDATN